MKDNKGPGGRWPPEGAPLRSKPSSSSDPKEEVCWPMALSLAVPASRSYSL